MGAPQRPTGLIANPAGAAHGCVGIERGLLRRLLDQFASPDWPLVVSGAGVRSAMGLPLNTSSISPDAANACAAGGCRH